MLKLHSLNNQEEVSTNESSSDHSENKIEENNQADQNKIKSLSEHEVNDIKSDYSIKDSLIMETNKVARNNFNDCNDKMYKIIKKIRKQTKNL